MRKQEERVSKAESKKRVSLEKFAINETAQGEVNKARQECLEALQDGGPASSPHIAAVYSTGAP